MDNGTSSNDVLSGTPGNDYLDGKAGNDWLSGGGGSDTLVGGAGNDTLVYETGNGVLLDGGAGWNTLDASAWAEGAVIDLSDTKHYRNLQEVWGTAADDTFLGNSAANRLHGGSGNDWLDGKGGIDTLYGGAGNDTYVVDNSRDILVEEPGEGIDTAVSTTNFVLSANVENLVLSGKASLRGTGNALDNVIWGNSGANSLYGGGGSDTLYGGDGRDTLDGRNDIQPFLYGGNGDDVYIVDSQNDTIVEAYNEGTDTVLAYNDYSLAGIANVERLIVSGKGNYSATGSSEANYIQGNGNDNLLSGGGGNDTLLGGAGNDTLLYETGNGVLLDGGAGWNVLDASAWAEAAIDLSDTKHYRNLQEVWGTAADDTLLGSSVANRLHGGAGDDWLDGKGGIDTLYGGDGNDTYVVDNSRDILMEEPGEGVDTAISASNFVLSANVENLVLSGKAGLKGTGNSLDNVLWGNSGANYLYGGGGSDTLYGGDGRDTLDGRNDIQPFLYGGNGDDVYIVDGQNDTIVEAYNEGTDTVLAYNDYSLAGIANVERLIVSGKGNYSATGSSGANYIQGNGNDNLLSGGGGNDTLLGGAGNDTLVYDPQAKLLDGGSGNDVLDASDAAAAINIDLNKTGLFRNLEFVQGGQYDDTITGTAAAQTLYGNGGNDWLYGKGGADTLYGGEGNDTFVYTSSPKTTRYYGDGGNDVLTALPIGKKGINLSLTAIAGQYSGIEILAGSDYSDTLTGGTAGGSDTICGGKGGDYLIGGAGRDVFVVDAGGGNDTIASAGNEDTIDLEGFDPADLLVYQQNSNLRFASIATGETLTLLQIDGNNTADLPHFIINGSEIYLSATEQTGRFSFTDMPGIFGTNENNILYGDTLVGAAGDLLFGLAGNDTIYAGTGNDTVYGGSGNDILYAGTGQDSLYGNSGNDIYVLRQDDGSLTIGQDESNCNDSLWIQDSEYSKAGLGTVNWFFRHITGEAGYSASAVLDGNDVLLDFAGYGSVCLQGYLDGSSYQTGTLKIAPAGGGKAVFNGKLYVSTDSESLSLSATKQNAWFGITGNDSIVGGSKEDFLCGGSGSDTLSGGQGSDILLGGAGDDILYGGAGSDILYGGPGNDTLEGDGGRDLYRFAGEWGNDVIVDSDSGGSTLNLTTCTVIDFTDQSYDPQKIAISDNTNTLSSGSNTILLQNGLGNCIFHFGGDGVSKYYIYSGGTTLTPFSTSG